MRKAIAVVLLGSLLMLTACRTPTVSSLPAAAPKATLIRSVPPDWSVPGAIDTLISSMTLEEKVAQMVMVRAFGHYYSTDSDAFERLLRLVRDRKVGGIVMAQGDVYEDAALINRLQAVARIPLLVASDFEHGVAMRIRRTTAFPDAMALGATRNPEYAYRMGKTVASEARAIGIHQNYAPVADINTNPSNPIINTRSYGDNVALVRSMVTAFVRGTADGGGLATAKHFPGHGDTGIDSHVDLPVLDLTRARLDSVEFSSFRAALEAGVPSVMIGHLAVPAIDSLPSSLSPPVITGVLRGELGFRGMVVSDALEMRSIARDFSPDSAALLAVRAGIDLLLVPPDPEGAITAIALAVRRGAISEERINQSLRRIFALKQRAGLDRQRLVDIDAIAGRVGTRAARGLAKEIARDAVTVLRNSGPILPLQPDLPRRIVAVLASDQEDYRTEVERPGNPLTSEPAGAYFVQLLRRRSATVESVRLSPSSSTEELNGALAKVRRADVALLCLFVKPRSGNGKMTLPDYLRSFSARAEELTTPLIVCAFGNPYVVANFARSEAVLCLFGDNEPTCEAAAEALFGEIPLRGRLPVTIPGKFPFGSGLDIPQTQLRRDDPAVAGFDAEDLQRVGEIVEQGIADSAFPGAQLAILRDGLLVYDRSFGRQTYAPDAPEIDERTLFDLASLTKVVATTSAVMKLCDQGRLRLDDPAGKYIEQLAKGEKAAITVRDLLLHRAGFPPFRKLWESCPSAETALDSVYGTPLVAQPGDSTIYSDLGMITLGKIVEKVTSVSLNTFVREEFTVPLHMTNTMFTPAESLRLRCAPTELDTVWRKTLVQGTVHDENAAFLGGVAGHAGLFSTASDLAIFAQMLLNKGVYAGRRYFSEETVAEFTAERSPKGGRYLGWDRRSPGASSAGSLFSGASFGHTGFTGTSIWIDPVRKVAVIFLTNRVYPTRANNRLARVRPAVHDAVMHALGIRSADQ